MPVIVNWAASALLGWAAVWLARESEELQDSAWGWIPLILVGYESLLFTPLAVYLFRFYPYWSTHYLFDPDIYPRFYYWVFGFSALVVLGNYACLLGSFFATRWLQLRGHAYLRLAPPLIAGVAILVVAIGYGSRWLRLADYYSYWGGGGALFLARPAGLLGLAGYLAGGGVLYLIWRLYGQRGTPRPWQA